MQKKVKRNKNELFQEKLVAGKKNILNYMPTYNYHMDFYYLEVFLAIKRNQNLKFHTSHQSIN